MPQLNMAANQIGITVLQAGTPESLEAVSDKWLDTHGTTEVLSIDLQVGEGSNSPLYLTIVYRRDRKTNRTT